MTGGKTEQRTFPGILRSKRSKHKRIRKTPMKKVDYIGIVIRTCNAKRGNVRIYGYNSTKFCEQQLKAAVTKA